MRLNIVIAVCVPIVAGCASPQERSAVEADMYSHCVSYSRTNGLDIVKECGSTAVGYRPSFSASYRYFSDKSNAQRARQAAAATPSQTQAAENARYYLGSFLNGLAQGYAERGRSNSYVPPIIVSPSPSPSPAQPIENPLPQLAPNGTFVSGRGAPTLCPDGSFVAGTCHLTPNGTFVGE